MEGKSAVPETAATRRGRPRVIDPTAIAESAIALWERAGYRDTGWQEIADEVGVSVRTLTRTFGSRAAIPWVGVRSATDRLSTGLRDAPDGHPVHLALREAIVRSVSHSEEVFRTAPGWLQLVANEPDLMAVAPQAYAPWTTAIADFVQRRRPDLAPPVCRTIAAAYQGAVFAALMEWARGSQEDAPDAFVDRTLAWLQVEPAASDQDTGASR